MRFNRLRLENFKCFAEADIRLSPGISVIHGINGSGKSSLLDACFFALYGTDALPAGRRLETIITKGETNAEIELWFAHNEYEFRLMRRLRVTDSTVTHEATLRTPSTTHDGITSVEDEIERILRMDAKAFLNCAYVKQGDITRLISASPRDRQRMIDDLLQLGKLEEYRDRMDHARRGLDRVRRDHAAKFESVQAQIESLESEDLHETLSDVNAKIAEVETALTELDAEFKDTQDKLMAVRESLTEVESKRDELNAVEESLSEKRETLAETNDRYSALKTKLEDLREERTEQSASIKQTLDETEVGGPDSAEWSALVKGVTPIRTRRDQVRTKIETLETDIETAREQAQSAAAESQRLLDKCETRVQQAIDAEERAEVKRERAHQKEQELEDRLTERSELQEELQTIRGRFEHEAVPDDVTFGDAEKYRERIKGDLRTAQEQVQEVEAERRALSSRIEHAETLLREGKCPECGQAVDEAPEVESLDENKERKEQLETEIDSIQSRIEEIDATLELAEELVEAEQLARQREQEISTFTELIDNQREVIDQTYEEAEQADVIAEEKRTEGTELSERASVYAEQRDDQLTVIETKEAEYAGYQEEESVLSEALTGITHLEQLTDQINGLGDQKQDVEKLIHQQESSVESLERKHEELTTDLDSDRFSDLVSKKQSLSESIERLDDRKTKLEDNRNQLSERRGGIHEKLERLNQHKTERDQLADKVDVLEAVVTECERIQSMYGGLRTELRRQNVRQLEYLINEIFSLVYQNDSYSLIELSDEYELTVHEKSGEILDPNELSGGEKALFNLSLRCAIYQLLAEGIGESAPLPPLILDEPTVHLDDEHVNRISDLVDRMRSLGVDQTIVVSHEAGIVDSADERIEVLQNPSTNRSRVTVESTDLLAGSID